MAMTNTQETYTIFLRKKICMHIYCMNSAEFDARKTLHGDLRFLGNIYGDLRCLARPDKIRP